MGSTQSNAAAAQRQRAADTAVVAVSAFDVITAGDAEQLQLLLGSVRDFNVNMPGGLAGNMPLHHAVHGTVNTCDMVRILARRGANLDALNGDGETPLIIAVAADREDVVRLLLELGADVDTPARSGATPVYYALAKRCRAVLPLLLAHRPNVNFLTQDSETILHAAVKFGDAGVVDAVLHGLRVYAEGRVLFPPGPAEVLAAATATAAAAGASSTQAPAAVEAATVANANTRTVSAKIAKKTEGEFRVWANTVSLLDARASSLAPPPAAGGWPIAMAVHMALSGGNSAAVRGRATDVALLLSAARTGTLLDSHLDMPGLL